MRRVSLVFMFCLFFLFSGEPSFAFASETSASITVMGPRQGAFPKAISFSDLAGETVSLLSADPNFDKETLAMYTGVPLQSILERAGVGRMRGVTVIGRDQYAVYVPAAIAANPQVVIASEREGKPLTPYCGGPLKLLFPPELKKHLSAYCWYVETLIPDYYEDPRVTVRVNGKTSEYTLAELDTLLPEKRSLYLSIPPGHRWDLPKLRQPSQVTAIKLGALLTGEDLSGKRLTLTPVSGRPMTLPAAPLISCEVLLVYRINGEPIHPAMGGPFSIYFPVLSCGELEGIAPETASFFYVNEISID